MDIHDLYDQDGTMFKLHISGTKFEMKKISSGFDC